MVPLATFDLAGETVNLYGCRFSFGRALGFVLVNNRGEPFGALTATVPGHFLREDELLVKTGDKNAPIRLPLLACGLFEDTGKRVPCGFVEVEVWRLAGVCKQSAAAQKTEPAIAGSD